MKTLREYVFDKHVGIISLYIKNKTIVTIIEREKLLKNSLIGLKVII